MLQHVPFAKAGSPPPGGAAFSLRLRHETHAAHDHIEANPRMRRLMAPDLTREEYRALTSRFYGFHAAAELAVAGAAALLPPALHLARRLRRTELLAQDLSALGVSDSAIATLPMASLPALRAAEPAWGLLYLLEGSSIGGQIIARHLAASLGLGPATGAAAVAPYGAEAGELWRQFKQALDTTAEQPGFDQDAVIGMANAGFTAMDEWMAGAW